MSDKKISELPVASSINPADLSVLISGGTDYQYAFSTLLQFISSGLTVGAAISFGTTLPQNITGKNGDVFINTSAGSFAQKTAATWSVVYTLPSTGGSTDGSVLYGLGIPASATGINNDTYINTATGIFYKKSGGAWSQVFSMQTGPAGPRGADGTNGTNGANGKTILNGTTNPSNLSTGTDGDFYINTSTLTFFGPKASGAWPAGTSIAGADGSTGPAGPKGDKGDTGDTGPAGTAGHGIVTGGTTGQVLSKIDNTDYNTEWVNPGGVDISFGTLFYSTVPTWDFSIKRNQQLVLYGNANITIENMNDGDIGLLILKQDTTGGRSLTITGDVRVAGSTAGEIVLSAEAGAEDSLYIIKKDTKFYVQVIKNYKGAPVILDSIYLDAFVSNIKAGFSTSKLFTTSTNCLRVRRSSDNTEQDFGFTDGILDVNSIVTFIGEGSQGYLVKWYDQTGNNNDYSQETLANQPKLKFNSLNGLPSLEFDGSSSFMTSTSFTDSSYDKTCTIITLANKYGSAFRLHESNSGGNYYAARQINALYYNTLDIGSGAGNAISVPAHQQNMEQVLLEGFVYDGNNRKLYVNNALYGMVDSSLSTDKMNLSGEMYLGNLGGSSFWWDGEIFTKLYLNISLSDANIKIAGRKLAIDYGLLALPHVNFDGNSLTYGVNSSSGGPTYPGTSYPSQLVAAIGGPVDFKFTNQGQNGASTEQIISNLSESNIYNTNGFCSKLIVLFWEGRNSLIQGNNAASAFSAMTTYLAKYRLLGYNKIAVLTCEASLASPSDTSTYGTTSATFETQRLLYNQMIRDNVGVYYDYVIDIAADPRVGNVANIGNTVYWDSAGVHMTDTGYLLIAQLCVDTLNAMLA
jgi:hypothetical protein